MAKQFFGVVRRILGWCCCILPVVLAALIVVTVGWRPVLGAKARPLSNRRFERTSERLDRGRYLVEAVSGCFDCHSEAPTEIRAGEAPVFTKKGAGRIVINEKGFVLAATNITPDIETGAGSWSDDQLARAIREGIGHDGRTLFPMMPYRELRGLSDEDVAAIVVYIRALKPVRNELPKRRIPFILSRLINSAPKPILGPVAGDASSGVSRGRYLTQIAGCVYCHTPTDKMDQPLPGMQFAGGKQIDKFPAVSPNITPDPSGIWYYDEALFIRAMRTGSVGTRPLNPPMPWWNFRDMTDEDLKAIFAYLLTVKPVHHRVHNGETGTARSVTAPTEPAGKTASYKPIGAPAKQ